MHSPFETFLVELAHVLQFPSLVPDQKGACLIILKEKPVSLLFEYDEQLVPYTVLLSSPLISFPLERRAVIYEICLKGNDFIEETLSVKPDEDVVYLHRRFHPDIQAQDLESLLNQFVQSYEKWKNKIDILTKEPPKRYEMPFVPPSIQVFPDNKDEVL